MTREELERRIETRMENCEDALQQWPDSPAWLARYSELSEVRHLVQQLDPPTVTASKLVQKTNEDMDMAQLEQDLLVTIRGLGQVCHQEVVSVAMSMNLSLTPNQVSLALSRLCSQGLLKFYQDGMYRVRKAGLKALEGPTNGQGQDPAQDQGGQAKASPAPSQAGPAAHSGLVPDKTPGGKRERAEYQGQEAQKSGKSAAVIKSWGIRLRKTILQALKERPNGGNLAQVTNRVEEILDRQVGVAAVSTELENLLKRQVVFKAGMDSGSQLWKAERP